MLRLILAVILGPLIGLIVLGAVDGAANTIFPPPAGVNLTDPAAIRAATAVLPFGAQVGAILAWLLGALAGASMADIAPFLHLGLALLAAPWAFAVGRLAQRQGCTVAGRALMALALLQLLLGATAAMSAAAPALVLLHNIAAALGVALLAGLGSARPSDS